MKTETILSTQDNHFEKINVELKLVVLGHEGFSIAKKVDAHVKALKESDYGVIVSATVGIVITV